MNLELSKKNDRLSMEKRDREEKIILTEKYYKKVIAEMKEKMEMKDLSRSKKKSSLKSY